jgi:hypothetical protein
MHYTLQLPTNPHFDYLNKTQSDNKDLFNFFNNIQLNQTQNYD